MINDSFTGTPAKFGTAGGFLTVLFVNLSSGDVLRTIILAAIGGLASFAVSFTLKLLIRKWKSWQ